MPVIILLCIVIIIRKAARAATPPPLEPIQQVVVYDPAKAQRERDRQRREMERQYDRQRKLQEQKRRDMERIKKATDAAQKKQEARQAAQDRVNWLDSMIERYSSLYDKVETELNENSGLSNYKEIQLQKQLLSIEEKIRRYSEQRDKAYFTAHS